MKGLNKMIKSLGSLSKKSGTRKSKLNKRFGTGTKLSRLAKQRGI